ncbi:MULTISPECIES: DUF6366 family protein [unclassified Planococcus (in: firmicutes)]|uniref:DUF6366 family protein n=1 Tax=Planococcus TaxID=1372 RepID=UPI000C322D3F|nr:MULTISPECIES: DUF6366 family protein [unclassified Planococcus (in: firmicutes)]AUD14524.1 hypothetical protein CW734_13765 [Planococcus sp. MB-3u-03]PKG44807.1 hypothetical protein CXF66_13305 [Planococcus sp. Urea-trap-24]PKG87149.1 hypothetical protein CXF91_14145 [Planococcus sp. Urea-3u-39]PKH40253.1 hypothetical protein CXF77_08420 [Planococcus sp. MB-3u-09]
MSKNNKPEDQRDRLQLKDQKEHAGSNVNDSTNRAQSGMPDTRGMGLKEIGGVILLLVILVIAYGLYQMFFG